MLDAARLVFIAETAVSTYLVRPGACAKGRQDDRHNGELKFMLLSNFLLQEMGLF